MDVNLRTVLAQTWLHQRQDHAGLVHLDPLVDFAHRLAAPEPDDGEAIALLPHVITGSMHWTSSMVPPFPSDRWGWTTNRRPAGDDLEVVLLADRAEITHLEPYELALLGPDISRTYLVRADGTTQPEVAGFDYRRPTPGWPPEMPTGLPLDEAPGD